MMQEAAYNARMAGENTAEYTEAVLDLYRAGARYDLGTYFKTKAQEMRDRVVASGSSLPDDASQEVTMTHFLGNATGELEILEWEYQHASKFIKGQLEAAKKAFEGKQPVQT